RPSLGDGADLTTMLGVAFPHDQVQILSYNRAVKDLGGLATEALLEAVRDRFELAAGPASPVHRGDIAMYFQRGWQTLRSRVPPNATDAIGSLAVSLLQGDLF